MAISNSLDKDLSVSIDWSYDTEQAIAGILGLVPEVGSLLSALVEIFWPSNNNSIWQSISQQVEQLIDQDLSALVWEDVNNSLSGLLLCIQNYQNALLSGSSDNSNPTAISAFEATYSEFLANLPSFQASGYEFLLLPLFAQFANLQFALMRDCIQYGEAWGMTSEYVATIQEQMTASDAPTSISTYTVYVNSTYTAMLATIQEQAEKSSNRQHDCNPFRNVNAFTRQMTLTVLDFVNLWPYFDPSTYPNAVQVYLNREIYSDPEGTCDDFCAIAVPTPPPTQPISSFTCWSGGTIGAVQVYYPTDGGPNGVTTTGRMGESTWGNEQSFTVDPSNPITTAGGTSGDLLSQLIFTFSDGSTTGNIGENNPPAGSFSYSYPNEIVSSMYIPGPNSFNDSAAAIIFGFMYQVPTSVNLDTLRIIYVSTLTDSNLDDLAKRCVTTPADLDAMKVRSVEQNWDSLRADFRKRLTKKP